MNKGIKLIVIKDAIHEDYKTSLERPNEYPVLRVGTIVEFMGPVNNFYGSFYSVRAPNDQLYYVNPSYVKVMESINEDRRKNQSVRNDDENSRDSSN